MMTAVEFPVRSEREWADLIRDDLGRAVEGIVASGKHLIEARCDLGRGRFGDMLRALQMHERTAERLMRIAQSPVLTDPNFAACLPTSMRTLAELTRFPSPILKGYLENGTINVATERAQVEALLKQPKPPTHGSGSELSQPVAESWVQSKPPVERMLAKQAENAEVEADTLAAEEVEAEACCCSFCDRADVDHLVGNAANTAFICWECGVQAAAYLPPQWRGRAFKALIGDVMVTVAHRPPEEPPQSPKRERPKGSKKTKRVAPARQHGDGFGDGTEQHNGGGAPQ
jgi:hypothetical protein